MAFANFSLTTAYTAIITALNAQLTALAGLFRDQTTGDFTNQIRYSSANKRLEYWTGAAWAALDLTLTGIDNASKVGGNLPAAFATAAQGTKADAALPAASYTAADVLTKIKTVDGAGSGLDADSLDGNAGTYYQAAASQHTKSVYGRSENNLRIVRVTFSAAGAVLYGSGATAVKTATGTYAVTFTNAFSAVPTVITSYQGSNAGTCNHDTVATTGAMVYTRGGAGSLGDNIFEIIAIGVN